MSKIELERCPDGHEPVMDCEGLSCFVRCMGRTADCWFGPARGTAEAAAEAWNTAMRATRAGAQVPQVAGGAVSKTTPSAVIGDDLTRGPSVEAPAILDDEVKP